MTKSKIPKELIAIAILGPICVALFKSWDRLPFNNFGKTEAAVVFHSSVIQRNPDSLVLKIENGNYHDIKDIEAKCVFKASSGTTLETKTVTVFQLYHPKQVKESVVGISGIPLQAVSVTCETSDVVSLDTYKEKPMPELKINMNTKNS